MSGMAWFRFYSEALADPKIMRICNTTGLPKAHVLGVWVTLLSMANRSPERGCLVLTEGVWLNRADIEAECGIDGGEYEALMEGFEALRMIRQDEEGRWVITNWEKRNFESDNATGRVRRWRGEKRERESGGSGVNGESKKALHGVKDAMLQVAEGETLLQHECNGLDTDTEPDTEADSETEREPENNAYADAGASGGEIPRTFQAWHGLVTTSKNPNARLREMVEALFPGSSPPDYGYIGRTARQVGGAGRLADLLWQAAAHPPTGDLLRYCQGMAKGGNGRAQAPPDPEAVRRRVHELLSGDDGD